MMHAFFFSLYMACGGANDTGDTNSTIQPMDTVENDSPENDSDVNQPDFEPGSEPGGEEFSDTAEPPEPSNEPDEPNMPGQAKSWEEDILPIMEAYCEQCHDGWSATTYADVVNVAVTQSPNPTSEKRVVPYSPGSSYLLRKVLGDQIDGEAMPRNGSALSNSDKNMLEVWISDGAMP